MKTIAIATRNAHKVREIQDMLRGEFRCLGTDDFPGAPTAKEDAATFEGNAVKKALALANWFQTNQNPALEKIPGTFFYVLADDSGLEVDALGGAPGVLSARFAADEKSQGNASDAANNRKLLALIEKTPREKRTARFRCAMALARVRGDDCVSGDLTEKDARVFEGACEGHIIDAPSGGGGFGYDPLFVPNGHLQTFAELGDGIKNEISHRAIALEKVRKFLSEGRDT
jgi:XTP/dITP diphosphohydrolase